MVVTLLIVLVLLFVLFRLMPGSAAMGLFMTPGITEIERNQIALRYGFAKEIELPGEYFLYTFNPTEIGQYTIEIESGGDTMQATFNVNIDPAQTDMNPPVIYNLDAVASGNTTISLVLNATDQSNFRNVRADIIYPDFTIIDDVVFTESETTAGAFTREIEDVMEGIYTVRLEATDVNKNVASAAMRFNVTTDATGNIASVVSELKVWNVNIDVPDGSIDETGDGIVIRARAEGVSSVTMTVATPDNTSQQLTLSSGGANWYNASSYSIPINGMFEISVIADGFEAFSSFPVNAAPSSLQIPADSTVLSDFSIKREQQHVLVDEYPFIYSSDNVPEIVTNVTAVQSNGNRVEGNLEATLTFPDGSSSDVFFKHPNDIVDRSMLEQFYFYMKSMLLFDFGISFEDSRPVWDVMLEKIPPTLLLFGSSLILSFMIGIIIGVIVAWRRGSVLELSTIVVTLFMYSMPIFWSALIAQWIFFVQLEWFPLSGMGGISETGERLLGMAYVSDVLWHLALPLMTLSILSLAGTVLLMRSSMLEVMGEDFITTARAKGLRPRTVVYKHAARNAMLPVVTSMALAVGGIISGGVLTETIFSWPGMGTLLVRGTLMHNYPIVQGAFYIMAGMTVLGNMFADILYAYLDPRVQL